MVFIPYKADVRLKRLPVATVLISVACVAIYYWQDQNDTRATDQAYEICEQGYSNYERLVIKKTMGTASADDCADMLFYIHYASDQDSEIQSLIDGAEPLPGLSKSDSDVLAGQTIMSIYRQFKATVPDSLSAKLWYEPESWNVWRMFTSNFAHADWAHVLFNLLFFFAFAATVESIIGTARFGLVIAVSALFTGVFYSITSIAAGNNTPTLGLSAVAMTMIALFAYLLPHGRIQGVFWVLIFFKRIAIPAWIVAIWYIGWDVYELLTRDLISGTETASKVDLVSHVTGAIAGYLLGVTFFRRQKQSLRQVDRNLPMAVERRAIQLARLRERGAPKSGRTAVMTR